MALQWKGLVVLDAVIVEPAEGGKLGRFRAIILPSLNEVVKTDIQLLEGLAIALSKCSKSAGKRRKAYLFTLNDAGVDFNAHVLTQ